MRIDIRIFAGVADLLGSHTLVVEVERDTLTVNELKNKICELFPAAASAVQLCFVAKNHAYAEGEESIAEGDEIALIPPVSGGQDTPGAEESQPVSANSIFEITREVINIAQVSAKVNHPNHGAALTFIGTTREITGDEQTVLLEYEAYEPMALLTLKQIGAEIHDKWPGTLTAITHRLGTVGIGEISVVIAVSTPHRSDCYEASRYAIERLKQIVPIWKKEVWADGSQWKGHQLGPWQPTAVSPYE